MRSKSELESLAARNGWKVGPLTSAQIRRMSSTEAEFHGTCNKKEFERACEEPKAKAASKANLEASKTQRMWADQATPEEIQGSLEEVRDLALSNRVIEAIKMYRNLKGVDLKEAKDYIDDLRKGRPASK